MAILSDYRRLNLIQTGLFLVLQDQRGGGGAGGFRPPPIIGDLTLFRFRLGYFWSCGTRGGGGGRVDSDPQLLTPRILKL